MIEKFTYGSDPEYYIMNEVTGQIVSSIPIIEGTKDKPESLGDGFSILKDNILAEGNVPPVNNKGDFIHVLVELRKRITGYIKTKYPVLNLKHGDCYDVDTIFLSHPEAMLFGCSPYLNAWDYETHRAKDLSSESFRTAGFHLHIGYSTNSKQVYSPILLNKAISRAMDLFLLLPSCFIYVDKRRFENYGGLGQYRDTPYGLEYRSLGGHFVEDKYLSWIFDQMTKALEFVSKEENLYTLMALEKPEVTFDSDGTIKYNKEIYNNLNIKLSDQLLTTNKLIYAGI
jgi:hypothetical protein